MPANVKGLKTLYSITEFATALGVSRSTISKWAYRGQIPTVRVGNKRYITLSGIADVYPQVWDSLVRRLVLRESLADDDGLADPRGMQSGQCHLCLIVPNRSKSFQIVPNGYAPLLRIKGVLALPPCVTEVAKP